ncbi:hypothetical protein M5X00_24220 [Paenibacillus alvei]|uniref:Uncharacterized protein n=1 Tax=Paenibacillus alvei TaxID=44250 RepID=A0ABT4GRR4_PAEAL|nr:hypothetical protein [Paenibacillus alvei]MCY9543627.1 hypothetical protein [Paenibacillus alvei]MCY9736118.1 hypothetical protein [Paenibacillus alvei]MCY9757336.1 hypothetical protein [Paenibacillus alvei]MCY9759132.1 hypothetical protein [Paenibacillus alvei]MCY9770409.1 hypothetical protein [Paenibacillus alvei]
MTNLDGFVLVLPVQGKKWYFYREVDHVSVTVIADDFPSACAELEEIIAYKAIMNQAKNFNITVRR